MPLRNPEVSARLNHLADLLEIEGANPFRVRAYRNAARVVGGLGHELEEMLEKGEDLDELPGIGKDLAEKLRVLVTTGELPLLKEVSKRVPPGLGELMEVPGLGPKRVQTLYRELHVRDLEDLKRAADAGRIRELAGFGEKTEEKLRQAVGEVQARTKRWLLADAEEFAEPLVGWLRSLGDVHKATIAGSYRRRRETVGDVDIIATCAKDKGESVIDRFVQYEEVHEVVSQGTTRATVILRCGLQVDLRVVAGVSYGAALHYFTGSREHNIALRSRAQNSGEKVNEYGIYRGDKRLAGKTEEEVYAHFGLAFIPPELREDRGELEAAEKDRLPELVTLEDIRGDLHCHTDYTDGHDSLEAMAREARKRGYEYLGITDHSKRVRVAGGLDARALGKELDAIDQLNDGSEGLRLLRGCEVDILRDGRLDLSDRTLARLDFTVCAIHYDRGLSRKQQT
ncbi:MAG: helix-hairpin-helix domain-containing protein, partial [Gammaproteobacteria bacterium]